MGFAYVMALLTGFVFAGFVSSLWPLVTRREVSFGLLYPASHLMLFEVFVVVLSTPLLLLKTGVGALWLICSMNASRSSMLSASDKIKSVVSALPSC